MPVEVKNLREWIYPASRELYQLLTKSALLQQKLPDVPMVPLLICRRASTTTHRMAKSMGFFVIQARQQFIQEHSRASHDAINEVREELGLFDLFVAEGPSIHIAAGLRAMKTKYNIVSSSKLWQSVANSELLVTRFRQLSQDMSTSKRSATMRDLRIIASEMSLRAGW